MPEPTAPAPTEISMAEFARRVCVTAHPLFNTTGAVIPCGTHLNEARHVWGLTQPTGTGTLKVVLEVRREAGL